MSQERSAETLSFDQRGHVLVVTLDRPEVHNAFNSVMQNELHDLWRSLRRDDSVRVIVLTGAGDKAFCTGIDRMEQMTGEAREKGHDIGFGGTRFHFDDPGDLVGPKSNDLWKPVIAAVNGMACGGAFYMLGEVDFIIASKTATFFDPHVTYGMTAAFEPLHMLRKMPAGDLLRMSLLGGAERLSAQRALQIGLVTELTEPEALLDAALACAEVIADAPPLVVEGTLRAIWAGIESNPRQGLDMAWAFIGLGSDMEVIQAEQERFAAGRRVPWTLR